MSRKILNIFLILLLLSYACQQQNKKSAPIDFAKVKKITIYNKVYADARDFIKKNVSITDTDKIQDIIDAFRYSKPISQTAVRINRNNGFFEIDFNEGLEKHSFTIIYATYDGVVIMNSENGDCFKNDRLEIIVYKFFI